MPFQLQLVPVAGFASLMAVAAFEDFRRLVIPNAVVLGLCGLWPIYLAASPNFDLAGAIGAAGCAVAVFIAGALLFSRGLVGGGDVKLLAAATLWAGPATTPALVIATAIFGGLLSLAVLSSAMLRGGFMPATAASPAAVPYGAAIAAAAVIVTLPSHFS
jgi:prepilin peptidase CpaA